MLRRQSGVSGFGNPFPIEEPAIAVSPDHVAESARAEARRQQVLDAAATCFRDYGFHATSIQRLSLVAGMSAGHIYHYFDNKEAIVTGIVQGYVRETLDLMQQIKEASKAIGLVDAMTAQVESGLALRASRGRSALVQEILAEASRNPAIAAALQQADQTVRDEMRELLKEHPPMRALPKRELDARITVMNTLFDGFGTRALCDPGVNKAATTRIVQGIMRTLLDH